MKPEAAQYLAKARQALKKAHAVAGIELAEAAGRAAYLAAFHAAQSLIFERTGKVPKTHRGVHAQFSRLAKDIPKLGAELSRFVARAYDFNSDSSQSPPSWSGCGEMSTRANLARSGVHTRP